MATYGRDIHKVQEEHLGDALKSKWVWKGGEIQGSHVAEVASALRFEEQGAVTQGKCTAGGTVCLTLQCQACQRSEEPINCPLYSSDSKRWVMDSRK